MSASRSANHTSDRIRASSTSVCSLAVFFGYVSAGIVSSKLWFYAAKVFGGSPNASLCDGMHSLLRWKCSAFYHLQHFSREIKSKGNYEYFRDKQM